VIHDLGVDPSKVGDNLLDGGRDCPASVIWNLYALHRTPYFLAMSSARCKALSLELYQMATSAPASANPSATAKPMPAPAPVTEATLPFILNISITESETFGLVDTPETLILFLLGSMVVFLGLDHDFGP
jgi:hypothetical protein